MRLPLVLSFSAFAAGCGASGESVGLQEKEYFVVAFTGSGAGAGRVRSVDGSSGSFDCPVSASSGCRPSFAEGTQLRFEAAPDERSAFAGWGSDVEGCGGSPICALTVNRSVNVLANFASLPAPVATVTVLPPNIALVVGASMQLEVDLRDAAGGQLVGRQVAWETSTPAVATVTATGLVHALAVGTATVTATSEGKSGSASILVTPGGGPPPNLCQQIAGASVIGDDGQFLGRLIGKFRTESIYNRVGRYGSEVSSTSIYNPIGRYGSPVSSLSAFNELASRPPLLVKDGIFLAYFTINPFKTPRVDPGIAETCEFF